VNFSKSALDFTQLICQTPHQFLFTHVLASFSVNPIDSFGELYLCKIFMYKKSFLLFSPPFFLFFFYYYCTCSLASLYRVLSSAGDNSLPSLEGRVDLIRTITSLKLSTTILSWPPLGVESCSRPEGIKVIQTNGFLKISWLQ
jgi:hypothetical protein